MLIITMSLSVENAKAAHIFSVSVVLTVKLKWTILSREHHDRLKRPVSYDSKPYDLEIKKNKHKLNAIFAILWAILYSI